MFHRVRGFTLGRIHVQYFLSCQCEWCVWPALVVSSDDWRYEACLELRWLNRSAVLQGWIVS